MNRLVSVLTPTYNHESFIAQCIESVLGQSYANLELIVIDDGSTDGTLERLRSYNDPRVRVIALNHSGVDHLADKYNHGLEIARGDLIAIAEGDDWWPLDKLEHQVTDFENDEVALSSGRTEIVVDGRTTGSAPAAIPEPEFANNKPVGRAAFRYLDPDFLTYTFPVATVMRAEALKRIGGFVQPNYLPVADYATFLRLSLEGQFRFSDKTLGYWRRHGQSVTSSRFSQIIEGAFRYSVEFRRDFGNILPFSDAENNALNQKWRRSNVMRCLLRGRLLARRGQMSKAAQAFRQAPIYDLTFRTRVLSGSLAALAQFGFPIEVAYRLLHKPDLASAITLDTGDTIVSETDMERQRPLPS